jgi:hypothetical protein
MEREQRLIAPNLSYKDNLLMYKNFLEQKEINRNLIQYFRNSYSNMVSGQ